MPAGYFGDPRRECRRGATAVQKYLQRISGPLLDRIDLNIKVAAVRHEASPAKPATMVALVFSRWQRPRLLHQNATLEIRLSTLPNDVACRHEPECLILVHFEEPSIV